MDEGCQLEGNAGQIDTTLRYLHNPFGVGFSREILFWRDSQGAALQASRLTGQGAFLEQK